MIGWLTEATDFVEDVGLDAKMVESVVENPQRVALLIHRFLKKRSSTHIPEPSPRRYLMRTPKPIRAKMAAKEPGSAHRR